MPQTSINHSDIGLINQLNAIQRGPHIVAILGSRIGGAVQRCGDGSLCSLHATLSGGAGEETKSLGHIVGYGKLI